MQAFCIQTSQNSLINMQHFPCHFKTAHVFVQTFIPSWAALMDATYPPGPDPITTRSTSPKQGNKISFKIYHSLTLIYLCITYSTS